MLTPLQLVSPSVATIKCAIRQYPLLRITGHEVSSANQLIDYGKRLGNLLSWDFGYVNELKYKPDANNYLYSKEAVPFHWDGAFSVSPYLLLFHAVDVATQIEGGETLFVDAMQMAEGLPKQYRKITMQYKTEKKVHYGGCVVHPIIAQHPVLHRPTLRFGEAVKTDKNPVETTVIGEHGSPQFAQYMRNELYHPANCYVHQWQKNELLIADNYALLHGRKPLNNHTQRYIRRVQVLLGEQ